MTDAAGINGSIRAHASSERTTARDTRRACQPNTTTLRRHALDLFRQIGFEGEKANTARRVLAALTLAARETSRLAGDDPSPATSTVRVPLTPSRRPMVVADASHLPPATANLGVLLGRETPSIGNLLAVTRVLAQTSRATATALRAADRDHGGELTVPARLTAVVLEQHGDTLASAVVRHRTVLGSLTAGSDAVIGQAREIGTAMRSVLLPLARHPVEAREVAPALCGYARATAVATAALTQAVDAAVRSRAVAVRNPSEDHPYPWRFASRSDVMPFVELLAQATIEIRSGLSSVAAITQPDRAAGPVATDATTSLRAALERRQIALRPRSPGWPALTSEYAQATRAGSRTWIA